MSAALNTFFLDSVKFLDLQIRKDLLNTVSNFYTCAPIDIFIKKIIVF